MEMLYPTSSTKQYPSVAKIAEWVKSVGISDTSLDEDNVRTLLDMLVYSGEIEALPAMLLENDGGLDSATESSEEEVEENRRKKRKKRAKSESESSDEDEIVSSSRGKKRKKKEKSHDSDSSDESDGTPHSKSKSKSKKKKSRRDESGSDSNRSNSDNDSENDSDRGRRKSSKSKARSRSRSSSKKKRSYRSSDESGDNGEADFDMSFAEVDIRTGSQIAALAASGGRGGPRLRQDIVLSNITSAQKVVYRALNRNPGTFGSAMGGWSQSPCGHCPRFDICDDTGRINPIRCDYYGDWFEGEGNAEVNAGQDGGDEDEADDDNEEVDEGGGAQMEIALEDE